MDNNKYRMSFTTGGLFHRESVKLAALYLDVGDWNSVRDKVIAENLLQTRTLNTLRRVCREVVSRLRTLTRGELECLVESSQQEQGYLLWLAVCRRYRFIADFAVEVLRERYMDCAKITNLPGVGLAIGRTGGVRRWGVALFGRGHGVMDRFGAVIRPGGAQGASLLGWWAIRADFGPEFLSFAVALTRH